MYGANKLTGKMEFYCGMSEFHCLVMILFSAMFLCFLLDSFELQEMVSIDKQNIEPLSLLSTSRGEHSYDTIFFPNAGN